MAFMVAEFSLTALLQERASRKPDAAAYTFIDYETDPNGVSETVSWGQVYQRAQVVAEELLLCGSGGDRVAILAPPGLEYIVAFLGALQAGFVAVPLPVPQFGSHDERVHSAVRDCAPSVILTTFSAAAEVRKYAAACDGRPAARIIEIDSLDLATRCRLAAVRALHSRVAYLQYTSGSTRQAAGVIVTHQNVMINVEQAFSDYFGKVESSKIRLVSWLPFYHDMGLLLGICGPLITECSAVLTSPVSFLQRPARWMQMLAADYPTFSAAPNFAFELAARRTTDQDMAGRDLANVLGIASGAERVHAATIRRFMDRFARCNLGETVIRPSYGLAEATVYVASAEAGRPLKSARFDYEKLSSGHAKPCGVEVDGAIELLGHGASRSTTLLIVDPETGIGNPAGKVGEIWVHGENVAGGYWRKSQETQDTFHGNLVNPAPGTPKGPWLRTGDLGVISDGELFIIGRIKDLLIVDGMNHYPDDIETTTREITRGRVAAISVQNDRTEQLVVIAEVKMQGKSDEEQRKLRAVRREVTSVISRSHGLRIADLLFVTPGSIPTTTSGKIRRRACAERYRTDEFERLDVPT
jgi:long-chain fatty acid adenylase/transferase FadD26